MTEKFDDLAEDTDVATSDATSDEDEDYEDDEKSNCYWSPWHQKPLRQYQPT
jgi:hypothetical protein